MAAALACGPGALLSHRSAADHLGLRRSDLALIDVTAASDHRRKAGIRTSLSCVLSERDRIVKDAIPCTSVALTLLNLAAVAPRRAVERACDEAEVQITTTLTREGLALTLFADFGIPAAAGERPRRMPAWPGAEGRRPLAPRAARPRSRRHPLSPHACRNRA